MCSFLLCIHPFGFVFGKTSLYLQTDRVSIPFPFHFATEFVHPNSFSCSHRFVKLQGARVKIEEVIEKDWSQVVDNLVELFRRFFKLLFGYCVALSSYERTTVRSEDHRRGSESSR